MHFCIQSVLQRIPWIGIVAVLCPLMWVSNTAAQVETTTSVRGLVSDSSGAILPGAKVTVRNVDTGDTRNDVTNGEGSYSFLSLLPGTYTVTVTKEGFKTGVVQNRVLQVGDKAEVDVTLQTGAVAETVTVSAAGQELINTATEEVASQVPSDLVQNIPLNGRDPFDLAVLAAGAVPENLSSNTQITIAGLDGLNYVGAYSGTGGAAGSYVSSGVILSGMRDTSVNSSVDGVNVMSSIYQMATDLQSPDDIQSMKIEDGTMNAEFGNGVSAVNIVTKSGTNAFHATLYDYFRDTVLDANNYFANMEGVPRLTYQWNEFGGAFGGPIKRNKLLFFSNYEGFRLRQEQFAADFVPDAAQRAGNFSDLTTPITVYNPYSYNPVTGLRNPFPNDTIPMGPTNLCAPRPTCVDPSVALFLQNWILPPNGTFLGQPALLGAIPTDVNRDQATIRMDWLQSSTSLIYARYTYFNSTSASGGLQPLEGITSPYAAQNAVLHWTKTISANLLNDAMVGYSRPYYVNGVKTNVPDVAQQIGLGNTLPGPGGPSFAIPYDGDSTGYFEGISTDNKIQLKDDLSFAKGRHNFKFGGEALNDRFSYPTQTDFKGYFDFTATWSAACPAGNTTCMTAFGSSNLGGGSFGDFLLGAINNDTLNIVNDPYEGHQMYYGVYGQDSWRVTRKLTLNIGLRYEHWTPWLVPNNTTVGIDFATDAPRYALQNPLDYLSATDCYGKCAPLNTGFPKQNYTVSDWGFAPRVGFAYNVRPQTVVRAGFGIFYDGNTDDNQFSNLQTGAAPFFLTDALQSDVTTQIPPYLVSQQFPAPAPSGTPEPNENPSATYRFVWPHYPTAVVDQWSMSIQRGLGSYWSLEADYIGLHNYHEFQFIDINAPVLPLGANANVSLQNRRPNPAWGQLFSWIPIGWTRYNGGTLSVRNRAWHDLTLMANFTWQKGIGSADYGNSDVGNQDFRTPYSYSGPNGITPYKLFVAGYSYQLPFGKGKEFGNSLNPMVDGIVGGWLVSGITTFSDGSPQPIFDQDESDTQEGMTAASVVPGCNPEHVPGGKSRLEWWNTACFVNPPFGHYGDSRLGAVTEPGTNNFDLSFGKSFATHLPSDSGKLEIRGDLFNAFNHTQWGTPDEYFPDPTFGEVLHTRPPRIVQVALRLSF